MVEKKSQCVRDNHTIVRIPSHLLSETTVKIRYGRRRIRGRVRKSSSSSPLYAAMALAKATYAREKRSDRSRVSWKRSLKRSEPQPRLMDDDDRGPRSRPACETRLRSCVKNAYPV
jgi:hypothetical protein